ncbi:3-oxoacyl-ACP reductase FabG [Persicobacter sp. CCB-QB2]|uniref:3-oxoacyl-ACP reductase FabG n=1 Tax=Persicobacter sp. CCB-QB2 TaxID=1561025 RepID=UPI001C111F28|nr:3-oxoacyl-ACP reductase FabG [Persicobacter sp. CCB-QB2]
MNTEKIAVVTGGSRGIGKGISKVFASQGYKVVVLARDAAHGKVVVTELRKEGGDVIFISCDVSQEESVKKSMQEIVNIYGRIDVLCANAGIFPQQSLDTMDGSQWDHVMATNLKSLFLTVKYASVPMRKQKWGRIIVTSSITGPITGYAGWTHYAASKAGQLGFIKTASLELAKDNITVNAVLPGNIITEGLEELGSDYLAEMAATIPMKRLGAPEDIGNAALFFASEAASYITGQHLVVDGGQVLPESLEAML